MSIDKLAEEQLTIHAELCSFRDTRFAVDWQTISSYFLPNQSDINTTKTENIAGWTQNIFDTTAIQSAQVLASGMFNWWTPPNQPWAEYSTPEELKQDDANPDDSTEDDSTQWLGKASDANMRELGRSNFYSVKGDSDIGLAVFGTDLMLFDESDSGTELFNFIHCKIKTYTIEENYKGVVDAVRREIEMTYRQIKQKFGKADDNLPEKMAEQSKKEPNKKFKVLHCIFPREDSERMPKRKDGANKPIASVYISMDFKSVIRVSGYDESPILCRRFAKWGTGAVWGFGPAYLALPDARQVNYVQQYLDALAELHAYPRVLVPDNLDGDVDLRAGGTTTYDSSSATKPEEWATAGDYKLGMEMQEQRRQQIRDAFFVDAFKLLNSQPLIDKEMTAYEISQRQAEQLQGITPVFTRSISEFINPLMQRAFGIQFRAGKLRNAPQSMMQSTGTGKQALVQPEVVCTSRFNDALRALKNRGSEETFRFILPFMQFKPELLDVFNLDKVIRSYSSNSGMAPDDMAMPKDVMKVRAERAKMMQAQRQAEMAQQLSQTAANVGKAPQAMQDQMQQGMQQGAGGKAA